MNLSPPPIFVRSSNEDDGAPGDFLILQGLTIFASMAFFTKSKIEDLRREADQLSICIEHFLYASDIVPEWDYKTRGFYDNCIEKCNGRLKAIHFIMESIRRGRPVTEAELDEARERDDSEAGLAAKKRVEEKKSLKNGAPNEK